MFPGPPHLLFTLNYSYDSIRARPFFFSYSINTKRCGGEKDPPKNICCALSLKNFLNFFFLHSFFQIQNVYPAFHLTTSSHFRGLISKISSLLSLQFGHSICINNFCASCKRKLSSNRHRRRNRFRRPRNSTVFGASSSSTMPTRTFSRVFWSWRAFVMTSEWNSR